MKKLLLLSFIGLLTSPLFSQITLQNTFTAKSIYHAHFKYAGDKLINLDQTNNQIVVYNLDQSVFKTIDIPVPLVIDNGYGIHYLTENLFDTDSTNFEYILQGSKSSNGGPPFLNFTYLFSETGNQLFERDTLSLSYSFSVFVPGSDQDLPIFATDSGTYMRLSSVVNSGNVIKTEFYKLPGVIYEPCCCDQEFATGGTANETFGKQQFGLSSYPNPSKMSTRVYYDLPQGVRFGTLIFYDLKGDEVRRMDVSNTFTYVVVSTDKLPSGTYIYRIATSQGISDSKKQIVIQ